VPGDLVRKVLDATRKAGAGVDERVRACASASVVALYKRAAKGETAVDEDAAEQIRECAADGLTSGTVADDAGAFEPLTSPLQLGNDLRTL
jgi:hypothetical protein